MATETVNRGKAGGLVLDVLTLIHAAYDSYEGIPSLDDPSDFTGAESRGAALLIMAQEKAIQAVKMLDACPAVGGADRV